MEMPVHDLKTLFDQLGLPSEGSAIDDFIGQHQLDANTKLTEAEFWEPHQASVLKEWMMADGEEVMVVDELNVRLHAEN